MGCSRWTAVVGSLFVVVFSIIALILIAVEVKNVLLPPGTKVGAVALAQASAHE